MIGHMEFFYIRIQFGTVFAYMVVYMFNTKNTDIMT